MRIKEAARELGISPDWLRELERAGRIPAAPRDVAGHRRYRAEDIDAIRRLLFPDVAQPVRKAKAGR